MPFVNNKRANWIKISLNKIEYKLQFMIDCMDHMKSKIEIFSQIQNYLFNVKKVNDFNKRI